MHNRKLNDYSTINGINNNDQNIFCVFIIITF